MSPRRKQLRWHITLLLSLFPQDSAGSTTDFGPQTLDIVAHSASRVARTNRTHLSIVRAAPTPLPSPSQKTPPSLLLSELISTRTRRSQAATTGEPQAAVAHGFDHSNIAPPPPAPVHPSCTETATTTDKMPFWWFVLARHESYPCRADPARHIRSISTKRVATLCPWFHCF